MFLIQFFEEFVNLVVVDKLGLLVYLHNTAASPLSNKNPGTV